MGTDVKLLGAVLLTQDGIRITGDLDLGKDLDIDILIGMFSVVSGYVEEAWGKGLDRIKLGNDYISTFPGTYTVLVVSSNGISKGMEDEIIGMLSSFETMHAATLEEWNGLVPGELEADFSKFITRISKEDMYRDAVDVAKPGFDLLSEKDVLKYAGDVEDAFSLYFLGGYHDTAYELATKASEVFGEAEGGEKQSAVFFAMSAKLLLAKRNKERSIEVLRESFEKAERAGSPLAEALTHYAYATYYLYESDGARTTECAERAKQVLESAEADVDVQTHYINILSFNMTGTTGLFLEERYDEAVARWKKLLEMVMAEPHSLRPVQKLQVLRQEMLIYNNIGFALVMKDRMDRKNYKDSIPYYKKAVELSVSSKARWYIPALKANLAQSLAFTGKFGDAKKLLDESYFEAQELRNDYRTATTECVFGVFYMQLGIHNNDTDELYKAMMWFKKAGNRQKDKAELENIEFFRNEAQKILKKML